MWKLYNTKGDWNSDRYNYMSDKDVQNHNHTTLIKSSKDLNKTQPSNIETLSRPNGAVYRGEVKGGQPHGRGTMTYKNGERYEG